ncbi:MAG: hypothetical protein Q7R70_00830 [Candidatus Diapherotrites archaeon]|nr:hypothetical protein [Candidatus Diapherotrites archaeon]
MPSQSAKRKVINWLQDPNNIIAVLTVGVLICTVWTNLQTQDQVNILQNQFDSENRPWLEISKITYQFQLPINNYSFASVRFNSFSDGRHECFLSAVEMDDSTCAKYINEFFKSQSDKNMRIIFYAKNIGKFPAFVFANSKLVLNSNFLNLKNKNSYNSGEQPINFTIFPQDSDIILSTRSVSFGRAQITSNIIDLNGKITYSSLVDKNKQYFTNFNAELGIINEGNSQTIYRNLYHTDSD